MRQGLEDRLSAEIGERFPPGIARINRCVVAGEKNFKSIGILGMFAGNKIEL